MYGAHEERENQAGAAAARIEEKRKGVLRPRGIAKAGGDGTVGRTQAGGAGGVSAVQVR